MTHQAIRIIRDEHAALAAMLRSIPLHLALHRKDRSLPDFAALRAMVFYLDEFPQRHHHKLETELLFAKLRARTPLERRLLDQLDAEHEQGERSIRELEHALLGFEMLGELRREEFERAVDRYVDFYLEHMSLEERKILPLAEQILTPDDWAELEAAFEAGLDPLVSQRPAPDYAALYTRIVGMVPAPIGLGAS